MLLSPSNVACCPIVPCHVPIQSSQLDCSPCNAPSPCIPATGHALGLCIACPQPLSTCHARRWGSIATETSTRSTRLKNPANELGFSPSNLWDSGGRSILAVRPRSWARRGAGATEGAPGAMLACDLQIPVFQSSRAPSRRQRTRVPYSRTPQNREPRIFVGTTVYKNYVKSATVIQCFR